jgi:hypothetical protein
VDSVEQLRYSPGMRLMYVCTGLLDFPWPTRPAAGDSDTDLI